MDLSAVARAAQGYANTRAIEPDPSLAAAGRAAGSFHQMLAEAETVSMAAMKGESSPEMLVSTLTQTRLAVDTAVAVRDKVVEAYQEILRMPV